MALSAVPHLRVGQSKKPTDANPLGSFHQMESQCLDKQPGGELLRHQEATGLRRAQLLLHPFDAPPQQSFVRLLMDMHDRWQHPEQEVRMLTCQLEVATDAKEAATAIVDRDAAMALAGGKSQRIGRRKRQIVAHAEGASTRQQQTIARLAVDRFRDTIQGQPALAGDHGIDPDVLVRAEPEAPLATPVEATRPVVADLYQREHVGKRVHYF